jgi:hypothetical protein
MNFKQKIIWLEYDRGGFEPSWNVTLDWSAYERLDADGWGDNDLRASRPARLRPIRNSQRTALPNKGRADVRGFADLLAAFSGWLNRAIFDRPNFYMLCRHGQAQDG